jgi:tetratricopeptide (TPR) repeat protein
MGPVSKVPDIGVRQGSVFKPIVDGASRRANRLLGWKAIGQFLGCTARTARRWESSRALPVHRMPGGRGSVWAAPEELTAWLQSLPPATQVEIQAEALADTPVTPDSPATAESPVTPGERNRQRLLAAAVLVLVALAICGLAWQNISSRFASASVDSGPAPYGDDPEANALYKNARFELATRSADSLTQAEKAFRQLTQQYPERAAGWSGLADSYLLLREFGAMPELQAYPEAARAARAAIALDPKRADAWLDAGFVAFWWERNIPVALRAFETAIQLDPRSAHAFHWYATALSGMGEFDKSLTMIARARELDPGNRSIVADESWLLFCAGRRAEGLAALEALVQIDPKFVSWHFYLARAYLVVARDQDFLREALAAAELRGQVDRVAGLRLAEEKFRAGGRQAMLQQLGANEADAYARGEGSATFVAAYRALAHDREGMLKWLATAESVKDHDLVVVLSAPEFTEYRSDPDFKAVMDRLR